MELDGEYLDTVTQYINQLWRRHEHIYVDPKYIRNYYPMIVHLQAKRLDLTLVSDTFFPFGLKLLEKIRSVFNQETIKKLGEECVSKAFAELMEDTGLRKQFHECGNLSLVDVSNQCFPVDDIYNFLLCKTFHGRVGAETNRFKEDNTNPYCDTAVDVSLRAGLKMYRHTKTNLKHLRKIDSCNSAASVIQSEYEKRKARKTPPPS